MSVVDQELIDAYKLLIIKQYYDKPKASAEIGVIAGAWSKIYTMLNSFPVEFDLDFATADRLDIIGRIVGINRIVPFVLPKIAFGFSENDNSRGFDDKFEAAISAPFQDKFSPIYTDQQLDDNDFRFFIRAKIAVNSASSYMVSDERLSINDVINTVFDGSAFAIDNKDMTLTLYITYAVEENRIRLIRQLGLLPKPQGVRYSEIIQYSPDDTFGFSDNPSARGFSDKFDAADIGGVFASKVI